MQLSGHCRFGDKCRYSHDAPRTARAGSSASHAREGRGPPGKRPALCPQLQANGFYPLGAKCKFSQGGNHRAPPRAAKKKSAAKAACAAIPAQPAEASPAVLDFFSRVQGASQKKDFKLLLD